MQEILFRGKPKSNNEYYCFSQVWRDNCKDGFVYGSLIVQADRYFICVSTVGVKMNCCVNNSTVSIIEVIPETVGPYTGLNDSKGIKIFEGDIVKANGGSKTTIMVVKYGAFRPKLVFDLLEEKFPYKNFENEFIGLYLESSKGEQCFLTNCSKVIDVIGNIHENPELLEVKE